MQVLRIVTLCLFASFGLANIGVSQSGTMTEEEFMSRCEQEMYRQYNFVPNSPAELNEAVRRHCKCAYTRILPSYITNTPLSESEIAYIGTICFQDMCNSDRTFLELIATHSRYSTEQYNQYPIYRTITNQYCVERISKMFRTESMTSDGVSRFCNCLIDKILISNTDNILQGLLDTASLKQITAQCIQSDVNNPIAQHRRSEFFRGCLNPMVQYLSPQDSLYEYKMSVLNEFCSCSFEHYSIGIEQNHQPEATASLIAATTCLESLGSRAQVMRDIQMQRTVDLDKYRNPGITRDAFINYLVNIYRRDSSYSSVSETTILRHCTCILDTLIERHSSNFAQAINDAAVMEAVAIECANKTGLFEE